jgi:hypothetical protein
MTPEETSLGVGVPSWTPEPAGKMPALPGVALGTAVRLGIKHVAWAG